MTDLRDQLEQMRDAYRGERYPGHLAAEILSPPPRKLPVGAIVAGATFFATAVAAAIVIYIGMMRLDVSRAPEVADATPAVEPVVMPEFPSDLPLLPQQAESLRDLGPMPDMPSIDFDFSPEPQPSEDLS